MITQYRHPLTLEANKVDGMDERGFKWNEFYDAYTIERNYQPEQIQDPKQIS
jgi:hypothetical protein